MEELGFKKMLRQWEERWLNMLLDAAEKTVLDDLRKWLKRNFFFSVWFRNPFPGLKVWASVYFGVLTILASLFSLSLCMSFNGFHSLPKKKKKEFSCWWRCCDLQSPARIAVRPSRCQFFYLFFYLLFVHTLIETCVGGIFYLGVVLAEAIEMLVKSR